MYFLMNMFKRLSVFNFIFFMILENVSAHQNIFRLGTIEILADKDNSSLFESVQNQTTLTGDELLKVRSVSLGETLKNEVGVTSTQYGPNASRPVIRGIDGDRIRILQNGLGVLDASGASQDHAVPIDPLLIDSVEIVRGPLSLLYGSSAVGGVINILTNRTHGEYEDGFYGAVDSQLTSVDNGQSFGVKADYGVNRWVFHADGNFRDTQDYKINGFARSDILRQIAPLPINQEIQKKQSNSSSQTKSGGIGASYVGTSNVVGVSGALYSSDYGTLVDPDIQIAMKQSRIDFVSEIKNIGFFKSIRIKSAQSNYLHSEIELGLPGTTFKNNGNETRLEFIQKTWMNASGVFGIQSNIFNFSALGSEAFLPETRNSAQALFGYEDLQIGNSKISFGGRVESNRVKSLSNANFTLSEKKEFVLGSAGVGYILNLSSQWSIGTQLAYSERAPNYQELFSDGAHIATFTYQIGDPDLNKEKVSSVELSLRHQSDNVSLNFSFFGQRYKDYIALNPTGLFDDTDGSSVAGDSPEDLQIYNYISQEAELYGAEVDTRIKSVFRLFSGQVDFFVKSDYLRGKNLETGFNLARMTPPRLFFGMTHELDKFSSEIEFQQVFRQTKTAPNELETDSYNQLNMGLTYKSDFVGKQISILARVNNIFNVEARNHVSILKDLSQIGGRNFSLGLRAFF